MDDRVEEGLDDSGVLVNLGVDGGGGGVQARKLLDEGVDGRGYRSTILSVFAVEERRKATECDRVQTQVE